MILRKISALALLANLLVAPVAAGASAPAVASPPDPCFIIIITCDAKTGICTESEVLTDSDCDGVPD